MFFTNGKQNGAPRKTDENGMRMRTTILGLVLMLGLMLPGLSGCGKKSWPEPNASQERYDFKSESAQIRHNCLNIKAKISGNKDNISKIILEITETDTPTDCPTCPFHPEMRVEFPLSDPQLQINKGTLTLQYCSLEADASYRWRLVGYNSYPGLGAVTSRVIMTSPNPEAEAREQNNVQIDGQEDSGSPANVEMNYTDTDTSTPEVQ